ncbi:unknown [Clostridium sp. CAG:245]|jgi:hypothetical protein|nr:unknown [Clostridium sp. CAG:245]
MIRSYKEEQELKEKILELRKKIILMIRLQWNLVQMKVV